MFHNSADFFKNNFWAVVLFHRFLHTKSLLKTTESFCTNTVLNWNSTIGYFLEHKTFLTFLLVSWWWVSKYLLVQRKYVTVTNPLTDYIWQGTRSKTQSTKIKQCRPAKLAVSRALVITVLQWSYQNTLHRSNVLETGTLWICELCKALTKANRNEAADYHIRPHNRCTKSSASNSHTLAIK